MKEEHYKYWKSYLECQKREDAEEEPSEKGFRDHLPDLFKLPSSEVVKNALKPLPRPSAKMNSLEI